MDFDLDDFEEDVLKENSTNKNVIFVTTSIPHRTHWPYDKMFATKRTSASSGSLATNLDFAGNTFPITERSAIVTTTPAESVTKPEQSFSTVSRDRTKSVSTNLDFDTNTRDATVRTTSSPITPATQYTQTNRFDLHPRTDATTPTVLFANITQPSVDVVQNEQTTASTPNLDIPMNDSPIEPSQGDSAIPIVPSVITESETTRAPVNVDSQPTAAVIQEEMPASSPPENSDSQLSVTVKEEEKSTSQTPNELNQIDNSVSPTQIDTNSMDKTDDLSPDNIIQVSSASQSPDMNQAENSDSQLSVTVKENEKSTSQAPNEMNQVDISEPPVQSDTNSVDNSNSQSPDDIIQVSSASQSPVDMNQAEDSESGSPTLGVQDDKYTPTQTPNEISQAENTEPQPSIDINEAAEKSDNINQSSAQACRNVNGEIEKQCNETVTQPSTLTSATESSESQPPGELNEIGNSNSQSINESDNEKTSTQQSPTISEGPIEPNDVNNLNVESHPIDEQTSNTTTASTDLHVIDEATVLEKENQQNAEDSANIVHITPPPLSNPISGTNELMGDKTTLAENEIVKDVDENASSIKLSSINVIVPLFLLVFITFKLN